MSNNIDFSLRDYQDGVNELFYQRWSPRAFKSSPVPQESLEIIFDAARWAPSCYNEQPWLFVTATEKSHETFVNLLLEGNQSWAKTAPVIGFVVASRHFKRNGKDNDFAQFDAGAAWMSMTLQARMLGLYTHGMGGIKFDEVYTTLNLDQSKYQVLCGFVLGELDRGDLVEPVQVSSRKALVDTWREFEGEVK